MLKPGDEVECVDASWMGSSPLREKCIYTVASVRPLTGGSIFLGNGSGSDVVVDLVEVKHPDRGWAPDAGFDASRFRKVQRRRSEAAVEELKRICLPQREPESA